MTEHADKGTRESFESAVKSFTKTEVALGEFVAAAQRFRSASESLEKAQADLELTRQPVLEALDTLKSLAGELERTAAGLRSTTEVLAKLDPDRFWSTFDELAAATRTSSGVITSELVAIRRVRGQTRAIVAVTAILAASCLAAMVALLIR